MHPDHSIRSAMGGLRSIELGYGFGGEYETEAQLAAQFGSGQETEAQLAARRVSIPQAPALIAAAARVAASLVASGRSQPGGQPFSRALKADLAWQQAAAATGLVGYVAPDWGVGCGANGNRRPGSELLLSHKLKMQRK